MGLRRPQLLAAIENADSGSAVTTVIDAITHVALDDLRSGRWDDAQTGLVNGIELCQAKHFRFLEWHLRLGQAMLSAARGDYAIAEQVAGALNALATHTGAHMLRTYAHRALAMCALGRGEYQTAYEHAAAVTAPGTFPVNVPQAFWVAIDLVEAAVRANRRAAARDHVLAMHAAGISALSPRLRVVVAASEAMATLPRNACRFSIWRSRCPKPRSRRSNMRGCNGCRRTVAPRPRHRRRAQPARLCSCDVSAPRRRPVGGARRGRTARGRSVGTQPAIASGVLTPQEHRVAALAASGMSNREIAERLAITPYGERPPSAGLSETRDQYPRRAAGSALGGGAMTIGEGAASQIVGRETELGLIDALLDDGTPGGGGALLLAGEPGVGKTTLLDAAVTAASDRGHEVARAIGVEFDMEVSFGALGRLLNGLHDEFQGVSAAYRDALRVVLGLGGGPTPSPMLVGNAILAVLEARAARRPVLLIADDLQWLDPASFVAVMFVAPASRIPRCGSSGRPVPERASTPGRGCRSVMCRHCRKTQRWNSSGLDFQS